MKTSILAKILDTIADSRIAPIIIGIVLVFLLYVFIALPLTVLKLKILQFVFVALSEMKILG